MRKKSETKRNSKPANEWVRPKVEVAHIILLRL